ncbi:MAG: ABC transporter permease [Acidimicrobiales bacterium]
MAETRAALARLALAVIVALTLGFLLLPLVALFFSMSPGELLANLRGSVVSQALILSLETSLTALVVIVVAGTPVAFWLAKSSFRGRRAVDVALKMPIVSPPAVAGVGLLLVFGRAGLLGHTLSVLGINIAFSKVAVIFAQVFIGGPFYVINAQQAFANIDDGLIAVSRTLGIGPWHTFWRTVVPLALPGMLSGAALSLARALGEFGATIVFAGNLPGRTQTFPLAIYTVLQSDQNTATAMSALLMVVAFLLLLLVSLIDRSARVSAE